MSDHTESNVPLQTFESKNVVNSYFDNQSKLDLLSDADDYTNVNEVTHADEEIKSLPWVQRSEALRRVEDQFTNYFLQQIGPTESTEIKRKNIFNKVKSLIQSAYQEEIHVLKYGSDPLKTYLPDSDIDITVIPKTGRTSALVQLKLILEQLESYRQNSWEMGDTDLQITQLVLIDQADVEIIKLTIANTMVDISIRQVGGLCTILFMERVSQKVPFLKVSILMLKAWMTYEASLLGSHAANMATYALYVLVIFLVNNFEVRTPMEVLKLFFYYYGTFDWDQTMVSIYSPIRTLNFYDKLKNEFNFDLDKLALSQRAQEADPLMLPKPLIAPEDLDDLQIHFSLIRALQICPTVVTDTLINFQPQRRGPNLKFINLIDPCSSSNNLGKSISLFNSHRLREAIKLTSSQLMENQPFTPESHFLSLVEMFKYTFECCGVLPPLALHLPQIGAQNIGSLNDDFFFDDEVNQTINVQIDVPHLLRKRTERLKKQLHEQQVALSQVQQDQTVQEDFELKMQIKPDTPGTMAAEVAVSADDLVVIMGGEHLLDDVQSNIKLKKALLRAK